MVHRDAEQRTPPECTTTVDDGTACVTIDGDTGLTVMDSCGSLQPVVNRLLFASPGYEAIQ